MPQNDDHAPKVMPDLGALGIEDIGFYRRFFGRVEEAMVGLLAFDPACHPVAVISPGLSPCIELTGLQWPSDQVMMGIDLPVQFDLSNFPPPPVEPHIPEQSQREIDLKLKAFKDWHSRQPVQDNPAPVAMLKIDDDRLRGAMIDKEPMGAAALAVEPEPSAQVSPPVADAPAVGDAPPPPTQKARKPAAGTKAGKWTEAEDAQAIELVANAVARDFTMKLALEWAADKLGRPLPATNFRVYHSLKARIDARVAELRAEYEKARKAQKASPAPKQTEPEPAGQVDAGDGGPKAADIAAPQADGQAEAGVAAPVSAANDTPLTPYGEALAWLEKLDAGRAKTPFTVQHDHDLLHFNNLRWPLHEIAAEIGLTVEQCKMRHSALTQMKKLRSPDVLAALLHLHPELAQNAA